MKILYVGSLDQFGTCLMRKNVLEDLGHEVTAIDTEYEFARRSQKWCARVAFMLGTPVDSARVNEQILARASEGEYDLLWVDKCVVIKKSTLLEFARKQPGSKTISYSLDDMMNPSNTSKYYKDCIGAYGLHVTNKSFNVAELMHLGAADVLFVNNAYHAPIHSPSDLSEEDRALWGGNVGFVGTYERDRAQQIGALADAGIQVTVRGNSKWKVFDGHPRITYAGDTAHARAYAKCVSATRINLGFLRKVNRDLQTTRTMEIPACAGFMLAERTQEHLMLFEEGTEAEYFEGTDELIRKCKYYLEHEEERARIALSGRDRCIKSGYSYHEQIHHVLRHLD